MNALEWIQNWFSSQANGDWEHQFGVTIETLDNPGWAVSIDLEGTALEGIEFECKAKDRNTEDWFVCRVEKGKFEGFGGPANLCEILDIFQDWAVSNRRTRG